MAIHAQWRSVQVYRGHLRQRTLPEAIAGFELADGFLPIYDVSDAVATLADADQQTAWKALLDVDLLQVGREASVVAAWSPT